MSNVIFAEQAQEQPQGGWGVIISREFWPVVDLAKMREAARIDNTVTAERLYYSAAAAVIYVNKQLADYKAARQAAGQTALANAAQGSVEQINGISAAEHHYLRAVYSYTKADLLETYADYDATGQTATRAEAKQQQAEDYRREAHAAIADLQGRRRVDSELI